MPRDDKVCDEMTDFLCPGMTGGWDEKYRFVKKSPQNNVGIFLFCIIVTYFYSVSSLLIFIWYRRYLFLFGNVVTYFYSASLLLIFIRYRCYLFLFCIIVTYFYFASLLLIFIRQRCYLCLVCSLFLLLFQYVCMLPMASGQYL